MEQNKKRRNLLIITPDQMRADYLGCYGHPTIGTAHLDRLAEEGVRFDSCYCAAPLCGPSRISFTTSTYFSEHNHRDYGAEINPDVPNLVTSLKKQGYRTGMFGKNHLFTYDRLPEVWDELDEICLGNCDGHEKYEHSFSAFTMEDDHPYNITGRLTTETIDFIKRQEGPFFAWVNYQDPHPAFACPKPYDTMFSPDDIVLPESYAGYDRAKEPDRNEVWRCHSEMDLCSEADMRKAMATYMGQVRYVDDSVGRLMEALKETGRDADTLVLFFSDHGELLGNHGMTHKIPVFYDALTRIPVILRHPAEHWEKKVFRGLVEEVDLAPTLLELLEVPVPATMTGKSLAGALRAGDDTGKDSALCEAGIAAPMLHEPMPGLTLRAPFEPASYGCGAMIRRGDWKLSVYAEDLGELYHVTEDPEERENLFENPEYADIRNDLTLRLLKRVLGVKIRDVGGGVWNTEEYPVDVRRMPLEV